MSRSGEVAARTLQRPWLLRNAPSLVAIEIAVLVAVVFLLARNTLGILVGGSLLIAILVLVLPFFGGRSLVGWLRLRWMYGRRSANKEGARRVAAELGPVAAWTDGLRVIAGRTGRGEEIGIVSEGDGWVAVLGVQADDDLLADSGAEIDLGLLDGLTVSDDILFAGVQVVTYTVPAPNDLLLGGSSAAAAAYRETAPVVPPAVRRTWICVRLEPTRCLNAVTRRGEGIAGIHATLKFGLHRVQSVLKRAGVDTNMLNADQVVDVLELTAGTTSAASRGVRSVERWTRWECDGMVHAGQLVRRWGTNPSRTFQHINDALASAPVLFGVTAYTLEPGRSPHGGVRVVAPNDEGASRAVDHLARTLGKDVSLALAGGTQVPTMLATVPLGRGPEL
ncbi:type VII secretion protein EccE [Mariniluteicoccus endophyticus]